MKTIEIKEEDLSTLTKCLEIMKRATEPKEWPQVGDNYWSLYSSGTAAEYEREGDEIDKARSERGLIFRTAAEALAYDRKRVITEKLRKLAGGFVPDWGDMDQMKGYLYYNYKDKKFGWLFTYIDQYSPETIYFASKTDAIEIMGDELYELFGVEK